jgi:hypothetical protein
MVLATPQFGGGYSPGLRYEDLDIDPTVDWLASEHYSVKRAGITIDYTTVPLDANGRRIIRGGTALGRITASDKYGPYLPQTNEVQGVAITGSPTSGTFTLTFAGQTTAGIPYNSTAAQVKAALVALSNVGPGDVDVTGGPLPGTAVSVTFKGQYIGTDVAVMTKNATGLGGGTAPDVVISTTTAGGANPASPDGRETGVGLLFPGDINVQWGDTVAALLTHGSALEARCTGIDAAFKADVAGRIWFQ